jgi:tetratricopeptide (TPR) repeat protein
MKNRTTKHLNIATLLGVLGLFGLANLAGAGAAEGLFAQGNQAWFNGDYASAIQCYETIAEHQGVSPALLGNLARAHQANGNLGPALLNFERARWLAPRDADIRAGLQHLRQDAGLFTDAGPRWTRPFLELSLNEWSWLAAAAWAVCGGLIWREVWASGGYRSKRDWLSPASSWRWAWQVSPFTGHRWTEPWSSAMMHPCESRLMRPHGKWLR